ncbi:MAG: ABC transporter permease [Terriglobales bacterium]
MNRLIIANLRNRPMRSLISIVAVAVEVLLILMIVGLTNGMIDDHRARVNGIGADIVIRSGSGSMFAELSGNTLPLQEAAVFARVPGVAAVAPVAFKLTGSLAAIGGINLGSFRAVSGGFRFVQGRAFAPGTHEVIVDDLKAQEERYHLGQTITVLGEPFRLSGIFEQGMGSRIYMDLGILDRLAGSPNKAAVFYVKAAPGADKAALAARLQAMVPADTVQSLSDYLTLFTASEISPALPIFQRVMVGIAVAIGFLVIFLSLYTTVLERTREIGILKALGASRSYIVRVILRESELLAGVGIVVGTVLAYGLWRVLSHLYPTLTIEMSWKWIGFAAVIAVASSAIGALYPAYKGAGQDAIAALAYE